MRQRLKLAAIGAAATTKVDVEDIAANLPTCPEWLPRPVAGHWTRLVIDMAAAGIPLKQVDSRCVALVAGYEADLVGLEEICASGTGDVEQRLASIRLKNQTRKNYLSALTTIGGTPVVRLRARIAPEEKRKATNDPWAEL
jgi:hypothetical protein